MPFVTRVNVDLPEPLKIRLAEEVKLQKRSQRAIVEIALEEYFLRLDIQRQSAAAKDEAAA